MRAPHPPLQVYIDEILRYHGLEAHILQVSLAVQGGRPPVLLHPPPSRHGRLGALGSGRARARDATLWACGQPCVSRVSRLPIGEAHPAEPLLLVHCQGLPATPWHG